MWFCLKILWFCDLKYCRRTMSHIVGRKLLSSWALKLFPDTVWNYYGEILSDKQEILLSANLWIPAEFGRYWELDLLLESWPVWVGLKCFLFSGIYIVYYTKKDTKEQFINHEKRDAFENPSVKVSNCEIECDELLWIRSSWGENFEDMPWIPAPRKGFWTETRKDEAFVTRWTFETLERCDKGFKRNLTSAWWSAWRPPTPPCCCWWAPWCWCWCWWRVARGGESSWSASRESSPTSTSTRWEFKRDDKIFAFWDGDGIITVDHRPLSVSVRVL